MVAELVKIISILDHACEEFVKTSTLQCWLIAIGDVRLISFKGIRDVASVPYLMLACMFLLAGRCEVA